MTEPTYLLNMFADCCIAWGYCHSAGKSDLAEPFRIDLVKLYSRIIEVVPDGQAQLLILMTKHQNPWVQHCTAVQLLNSNPNEASTVLEYLATQDGMWALSSQVVLGSWRQRH